MADILTEPPEEGEGDDEIAGTPIDHPVVESDLEDADDHGDDPDGEDNGDDSGTT